LIQEILNKIYLHPIVPVFYHENTDIACNVLKACYDGGIRTFEFTNRGENAFEVFNELTKYKNKNFPEMLLGIGSIITETDTELYIASGTDFIVSPILNSEMAKVCNKHNKLWIPGCATPTEIYHAELLGATLIKLFPGNTLGPDFAKAILAPMPWLQLMPTGGIEPTEDCIQKWFNAGVKCIGMGSQLLDKKIIDTKNYAELTTKIQKVLNYV